jgi:hypothetical protein
MWKPNMITDLSVNSKCLNLVWELTFFRRDEFFAALKKLFFEMMNENLPIYGVAAAKLKEYSTSKKDMKAG